MGERRGNTRCVRGIRYPAIPGFFATLCHMSAWYGSQLFLPPYPRSLKKKKLLNKQRRKTGGRPKAKGRAWTIPGHNVRDHTSPTAIHGGNVTQCRSIWRLHRVFATPSTLALPRHSPMLPSVAGLTRPSEAGETGKPRGLKSPHPAKATRPRRFAQFWYNPSQTKKAPHALT